MLFLPVEVVYAADAPAQQVPPGASGILSVVPLLILFVIFYFLLIRPQQKRAREHKEMLSKIEKGDNVITSGGLHGRVTSVAEDAVTVEVAENVRVKISKDAIMVLKKPQS